MQTININEIFASINGEVNKWHQGSPTVFVRFQGCNLSCDYCDTKHAQSLIEYNEPYTIPELLTEIKFYRIKRVTITGGEPLLQKAIYKLIVKLAISEFQISIETNGSVEIPTPLINNEICWIVDYKIEFADQMIIKNYLNLTKNDWVKFVIPDRHEFDRAILIKENLQERGCKAKFAFSPIGADFSLAGQMVDWLIEEEIDDVVLNLQIHKIINAR